MNTVLTEILRNLPQDEESQRLFHGRGKCFPDFEDLVIDWFRPVAMVILYRQRSESWLAALAEDLRQKLDGIEAVLLQERFLPEARSRILWGELPSRVNALEDGLCYRLRLDGAQNIGFFPDMAIGRRLIRKLSPGKKILNLFSYSCSFSVAALAGGASQVVNLDMNRGALDLGRLNHQINGIDMRQASFLALELFRSFGKLRKLAPFDLIVCDPPAAQGKSFLAVRDWPKLLRRLPDLLFPGGQLLLCLNGPEKSPEAFAQLVAEILPQARLEQKSQPGKGFPEADPSKGVWLFLYGIS